jgi:sugar/nucleoside kinase (ribokinase family)
MPFEIPLNLPGPRPAIAGTGLIALDVVIPNEPQSLPQLWAGGTCGNVLTALAYFGWDAYPIARLRDDASSSQITHDFARWEVRLDYLSFDQDGSTPVIVQHIHCAADQGRTHSFSRKCPFCGKRLPWYKPLRVADAARLLPGLPPIATFFFDRTSPGALHMAKHAAKSGALVVFEPSSASDRNQLRQAMQIAHVIKYSHERLSEMEEVGSASEPLLIIETRGSAGLRFLSRLNGSSARWQISEPLSASKIVDTAGCGDWCTAGIIATLGRHGIDGFLKTSPDCLREALRFGQALAAWNCGFEGARGGMYRMDKSQFLESIERLLAGDTSHPLEPASDVQDLGLRTDYTCAGCGGTATLHQ